MNNLKGSLLLSFLAVATTVVAQPTVDELISRPELSATIYFSYDYRPADEVKPPKGYQPFYISHYGRHGSRYHASWSIYEQPLLALRAARDAGLLTPRGAEVLACVEFLAADAEGRCGDLSPRGVQEHRGIAERMFRNYPEVFSTRGGRECRIDSRSTQVPRCILSMAAFNERLKELNSELSITRTSSKRDLGYMANGTSYRASRKQVYAVADSLLASRVNPDRLVGSLVRDPSCVEDPLLLMKNLFLLCAITQDVSHLKQDAFYDIFTGEELYRLWECENVRRYLAMANSARFGKNLVAESKPLLRNIIEKAREVVEGRSDDVATLRFGNDVYLTPLLALLRVEGTDGCVSDLDQVARTWVAQEVTPMAANIQFVFFRNKTGDVLVRVLHNEHDVKMPLVGAPFYPWRDLEKYCEALYE